MHLYICTKEEGKDKKEKKRKVFTLRPRKVHDQKEQHKWSLWRKRLAGTDVKTLFCLLQNVGGNEENNPPIAVVQQIQNGSIQLLEEKKWLLRPLLIPSFT